LQFDAQGGHDAVGTFKGKSAKMGLFESPLSAIAVTNGPILQAGINYWLKVVPAADSWSNWYWGNADVQGWHFFENNSQQTYSLEIAPTRQAAIEVRVLP
jgi:hypothetical protein